MTFEIITHKTSHSASLPAHFDICRKGQADALITVWTSIEDAEFIVGSLTNAGRLGAEPPPVWEANTGFVHGQI